MVLQVKTPEELECIEICYQNGTKLLLQNDILLGYVKQERYLRDKALIQYIPSFPKPKYREVTLIITVLELEEERYVKSFMIRKDGTMSVQGEKKLISHLYIKKEEPISYFKQEKDGTLRRYETDGVVEDIFCHPGYEEI